METNVLIEQEHGEGPETVYVYYFPSQAEGREIWPCKIGKSSSCPLKRIKEQQASMQEEPVVGLLIRTRNAFWTEQFIHGALEDKRLKAYGAEWFETNPAEILDLYRSTQTKLDTVIRLPRQLGAGIRRARRLRRMSQAELAEAVGTRQATVSRIENGSPTTSIDTIHSILAVLELELVLRPRRKGSAEDIERIF